MNLDLIFDFVSIGFFMCVSLISGLVFLYSIFYMEGRLKRRRFLYLVFFFVFSIFLLVFSGNFFLVMVGWDGLGLVSFCLVIFYNNKSVLESGLITVFSNRVGDVFFLVCFFLFMIRGSYGIFFGEFFYRGIFSFLIFFGAATKRAQVPFSAWLPAAMAAPTPVSSLVHSSTLVTAGLYVIIRFNYLFYFFLGTFFIIFSLFTMLLAGICALIEVDLKKVVAISTLSQLGLMLYVISIGCWFLSFLHIIVHAFFKSILFLSTGSLISQIGGGQDSRFFGRSLINLSTFYCFMVRRGCLVGFPFFIGFYSKDRILSQRLFGRTFISYFLFFFGCTLTVGYRVRLLYLSFYSLKKIFSFIQVRENLMFFVLIGILSFICWIVGGMFYWFFLFDLMFFFCFFDYLIGIFIIIFGILLFMRIFITKFIFFSFSKMRFFGWVRGSRNSVILNFLNYFKIDRSWIEFRGGFGRYLVLFWLNRFFVGVAILPMGFLFLFFIFF